MRTVYVVGIPGAGKTTAVAGALEILEWRVEKVRDVPLPYTRYTNGAIQLGKERGTMSGTDALSMSISPTACQYVRTVPTELLLAEGDRLAHAKFFEACLSVGELDIVFLDVSPSLAHSRTVFRGGAQNAQWVRGRITKIDNLIARYPHYRIDASKSPEKVAAALADRIGGAA